MKCMIKNKVRSFISNLYTSQKEAEACKKFILLKNLTCEKKIKKKLRYCLEIESKKKEILFVNS